MHDSMWTYLRALICFQPRGYELLCQNVPQHATDMRQCDEKKPSCGKCVNHSIECDFSVSTPTSPSPSPPAASSAHQRYRFRQSKYQTLASPAPNEAQRPGGNSIAVQCDFSANISAMVGISFADLQLFHHYLISTYRTLTDEASDPYDVWSIHIPQWGIAFPSILHLMLALSALHLGHEKPELRHQYVMQANDHFTFGIRSVTTVLSQLNSENCQLIYMSAVMICLVYFGHGPRPGEYLVFSSQGQAEWLVLMRGVRSILATNHDKIFSGVLTPQTDDSIQSVSPELQGELRQHHDRIVELKTFIEIQTAGPEKDLYLSAVGSLPDTFDEDLYDAECGKGRCMFITYGDRLDISTPRTICGAFREKGSFRARYPGSLEYSTNLYDLVLALRWLGSTCYQRYSGFSRGGVLQLD